MIGPAGIARATRGKGANTRHIYPDRHGGARRRRRAPGHRGLHARGQLVELPAAPARRGRLPADDLPRGDLLPPAEPGARASGCSGCSPRTAALDETMAVQDHDVVLVPKGHHPCAAPYGYDMYYLNVMAGPLAQVALPEPPRLRLDPSATAPRRGGVPADPFGGAPCSTARYRGCAGARTRASAPERRSRRGRCSIRAIRYAQRNVAEAPFHLIFSYLINTHNFELLFHAMVPTRLAAPDFTAPFAFSTPLRSRTADCLSCPRDAPARPAQPDSRSRFSLALRAAVT